MNGGREMCRIWAAAVATAAVAFSFGLTPAAPAAPALEPAGCEVPRVGAPVSEASVESNRVSVTFDEQLGENTRSILATFDRFRTRATFFIPGRNALDHPRLARMVAARGHELANHSQTHPDLTRRPDSGIQEMRRGNAALERLTGFRPCLFRPPFGTVDEAVVEAARRLDLRTVLWSAGGIDPFTNDPEVVAEQALDGIRPGSIILLHQTPHSAEALPKILKGLRERGLRSVPVTRLLGGRFED